MKNITLLDTYEQNAFDLEKKYLKSLDANKLLKGFCEIAGIELNATKLYSLLTNDENLLIKEYQLPIRKDL